MTALFGTLIRTLFTETAIKKLTVIFMDFLVKSTKNDLDDKMWSQVKRKLFV